MTFELTIWTLNLMLDMAVVIKFCAVLRWYKLICDNLNFDLNSKQGSTPKLSITFWYQCATAHTLDNTDLRFHDRDNCVLGTEDYDRCLWQS